MFMPQCPTCNGTGRVRHEGLRARCSTCNGCGRVVDETTNPEACVDCGSLPGEPPKIAVTTGYVCALCRTDATNRNDVRTALPSKD